MAAGTQEGDERAEQFMQSLDPRMYVGARHHTVPRFLLGEWSSNDQVQVYSRVDGAYSVRNIKDLEVKDFHTFVDLNGELDSSFESVLGTVEEPAAAALKKLMSPFTGRAGLSTDELV